MSVVKKKIILALLEECLTKLNVTLPTLVEDDRNAIKAYVAKFSSRDNRNQELGFTFNTILSLGVLSTFDISALESDLYLKKLPAMNGTGVVSLLYLKGSGADLFDVDALLASQINVINENVAGLLHSFSLIREDIGGSLGQYSDDINRILRGISAVKNIPAIYTTQATANQRYYNSAQLIDLLLA